MDKLAEGGYMSEKCYSVCAGVKTKDHHRNLHNLKLHDLFVKENGILNTQGAYQCFKDKVAKQLGVEASEVTLISISLIHKPF